MQRDRADTDPREDLRGRLQEGLEDLEALALADLEALTLPHLEAPALVDLEVQIFCPFFKELAVAVLMRLFQELLEMTTPSLLKFLKHLSSVMVRLTVVITLIPRQIVRFSTSVPGMEKVA